jgi:hypothetical protein
LAGLYPFFEKVLRLINQKRRQSAIVCNIARSEAVKVKRELFKAQNRVIKITESTMCPACGRRLGNVYEMMIYLYIQNKKKLFFFGAEVNVSFQGFRLLSKRHCDSLQMFLKSEQSNRISINCSNQSTIKMKRSALRDSPPTI